MGSASLYFTKNIRLHRVRELFSFKIAKLQEYWQSFYISTQVFLRNRQLSNEYSLVKQRQNFIHCCYAVNKTPMFCRV